MAIDRTNILSLIKNRKYHSCILTTFSFDFYFFNMKVLKWLRSCGIYNVNVLIDGHFYSELLRNATGEEKNLSAGFSLYPVFEKGIFHPKIMMLFGVNEGLLIVGSGNLTNAGNGNNDEIWGAFRFNRNDDTNAHIFSSAWKYLSRLTANTKGITNEKTTKWILDESSWLLDLPTVNDFQFYGSIDKEEIAFLYNSSVSTIWQQVTHLIGNEEIVEINAVSPYYDTKGNALETIKTRFPKAKFNVVIDKDGIIPNELENSDNYLFYDWKELNISRNIGSNQMSRLHAKILLFRTRDNTEYCLFGSANITNAGLGIFNFVNNELSLFVKSANGDLSKKIGLHFPANKVQPFSAFKGEGESKTPVEKTIIQNNSYRIKLLSAELNYSNLIVFSTIENELDVQLTVYDSDNLIIRTIEIPNCKAEQEVVVDFEEDNLQYVQFQDLSGKIISNKIIVSNYISLAKTNPNSKNAEFESCYGMIQNGDLRGIFDLIYFATIDDSEKEDGNSILSRGSKEYKSEEIKSADQTQLYDLSGYKPMASNLHLSERALMISPSLRVLDAIKFISEYNEDFQSDINEDEQQEDISSIIGEVKHVNNNEKNLSLKTLEFDKRKLLNYFSKLYNHFHKDLFGGKDSTQSKTNLNDLSKYLISVELMLIYGGKFEQSYNFNYLPYGGGYELDNVKGCCLNIVGDFLRLSKNGFKEYSFDYTIKKLEKTKYEALVSTLTLILHIQWENAEKHYFTTLLLNTLHYLGWSTTDEINNNMDKLLSDIEIKTNKIHFNKKTATEQNDFNYVRKIYENQLDFFSKIVLPAFREATSNREMKSFSDNAFAGQIIYSSIAGVGYCYVASVINPNEYRLARAGFAWDPKGTGFTRHFSDSVYTPLPLSKMTIINI